MTFFLSKKERESPKKTTRTIFNRIKKDENSIMKYLTLSTWDTHAI